ncbi:hypothetical protein [Paenibacillus amylolyticus]|uniref:hypothetical protein n=1 Tax=Paenibacillus amylolyticus TaxID=1451 RepID=UPI003EBFBB61
MSSIQIKLENTLLRIYSLFRKILITTLISNSMIHPYSFVHAGGGPGTKPEIRSPYMVPAIPAKSQNKIIPMEGERTTNIGIFIYQHDDHRWRVEGGCNGPNTLLNNDPATNRPVSSTICVDLDLDKEEYKPTIYLDENGDPHPRLELTEVSLAPHYMDDTKHYDADLNMPQLLSVHSFNGRRTKFIMKIGGIIPATAARPYNPPKWSADYIFNTDLYWKGQAEITKEINLTSGGQIRLNQTKQLNATVKTKTGDGSFGAETNVNIGSGGTTT